MLRAQHVITIAAAIALIVMSRSVPAPVPRAYECTTGLAESITDTAGNPPSTFPVYAAPASAPWVHTFYVLDAGGRPLKNVAVAFTLPGAAPSGRFGKTQDTEFVIDEATSVIATTGENCLGIMPELVVDAAPGRFVIDASVIARPFARADFPVVIVADARPEIDQAYRLSTLVLPNAPIAAMASARWSNAVAGGRLGGVGIRFTTPGSGPSAVFDNGGNVTAVLTNPVGVARVEATTNALPGLFEMTASIADTSTVPSRFSITGVPEFEVTGPSVIAFGALAGLKTVVRFPWADCGTASRVDDFLASVSLEAGGVETGGEVLVAPFAWPSCFFDPGYTVRSTVSLSELGFGTHQVRAVYAGNDKVARARSEPVTVTIAPHFEMPTADGGTLKLGVTDPLYNSARVQCALFARAGTFGTEGWPAQPPPGTASVSALFVIESHNCQWSDPAATDELPPLARRVLVERDIELPPGTVAWAYGPTADDASDHWHELRTSAAGRAAYVEIADGGAGDSSLAKDARVRATIALAAPRVSSIAGRLQDLWWAGPQESGWGMSLTQHREALFGELFVYDAEGTARWLVMPGGQWNAERTAFTASVYRPRGMPLGGYDASRFVIGNPVGTVTITASAQDKLRLDYTIDGVKGTKQMSRLAFGPRDASPLAAFDDLWWAGTAHNGWGLVVAQQYRTLFAILYTYDQNMDATWYVAPGSTMTTRGKFEAKLYRPRGSSWLGAAYDPAKHSLENVGSLGITFANGWDSAGLSITLDGVTRSGPITRVPF